MASTQETWEAILQSLNNQTIRFEPFRGLHKDIEVLPNKDGSLYFAYDTGSIFLDMKVVENGTEVVKRYKMGGSGSGGASNAGFIYTNASMNDDTLVKVHSEVDNIDSPGFYIYRKAFNYKLEPTLKKVTGSDDEITIYAPVLKPESEWGPLPDVDVLLLNSNGWIFRVVAQEGQLNRVIANIISTGSSNGSGGGGGGGGSESSDDLFLNWGTGWRSNGYYVYGQTNELEVTPISTRDTEVQLHIFIEDTNTGKTILDIEPSLPSGEVYKLNTGILPLSQKGISITISLDSTSSRMYKNYKPKQTFTGISVFQMDLTKQNPDEFYPLNGLNGANPTQIIRYIPTGSSSVEAASPGNKQILHVFLDNEEIITKNIDANQDGRQDQVSIPGQTHGMHVIKLQLSAVVNNITLYSNELTYQCAWVEDGAETPIVWIGSYDEMIVNYENSYIKYMVYDPLVNVADTNGIQISLYKNGEEVNQISTTYTATTSEWLSWDITELYTAPSVATGGNYATTNFSIAVRGVKADVSVVVTNEGSRDLSLRKESSLMANFSAAGRSNDEIAANRGVFRSSVGNAIAELNNFNWQNNGWGKDAVGTDGVDSGAYLTIANGASVTIPFQGLVLNEVSKPYSFEIRFRVRNIQAYSTLVTTIPYYFYIDEQGQKSSEGIPEDDIKAHPGWSISKDADGNLEMDEANSKKEIETENGIVLRWLNDQNMGFVLGTQEAYFNGPNGTANVRYGENEVINISFVIEPTDKLCYIYLNGILSGAIGLPNPAVTGSAIRMNVPFEINSNYCDFDLYRFRVYQDTLSMPDVIHNYLSDLHSIKLYDQNDLARLTDPTELDFERLVKYNQDHPGEQTMPYAVWTLETEADGDVLPYFKGNKKKVTIDFVNPCADEALDLGPDAGGITEWYYYTHSPSYHAEGVEINVQGTSSQKYPRRNFKTKYKKAKNWVFTKGPLTDYSLTNEYYFYKDVNAVPAVQRGKLVTKIESYEEEDTNGNTVTKYREVPETDSTLFNTETMVKLVAKFHMDQEAVATNQFTWKIDYMESSGSYNTGFANLMGNQVHPLYNKHPLDDMGISSTGMRTSVYGYPVLVFQRYRIDSVKAQMNDGYEYKYIGRYNKNLDKSSNEYYGFELKNNHPYLIRPWDEYKTVQQTLVDDQNNPILDDEGHEQTIEVQQFKAHHERPYINQAAECWELRDNQGTWCSFRYPNDAARSSGFRTLVAGTSGDSAELEVIKHFEYRYTVDEDALDAAYAYENFTDENGVKHEDRQSIIDYLVNKYSNLEVVFNWLDSTDSSSVPVNKPRLAKMAGPWVTSKECTDVGETSTPEFTYQQVGSSAIFDNTKTYYRSAGGDAGPFTEATGLTSLTDYELVVKPSASNATPLKGTENYYVKDINDNYTLVSLAQLTIPSKTDNVLINIDNEGKFTLYKFTKTEDVEIDDASIYYTFTNGVYVLVSNPLQEELDDYYEASLEDTPVYLYKLIHPIFYEKVIKYYYTTFENDTENYRLAKFRNEFDLHLDKEYCLVYFILTELLLCYDSRGKNMMFASWGPREWIYEEATDVDSENITSYFIKEGAVYSAATTYDENTTYYNRKSGDYIWYPIFYDIDTQLGLNNSGAYLWDYDADVTTDNIFSTPNSVLWNNFYTIFYDDIVQKYRALRVNHLDYGPIKDAYECLPSSFDSYAMRGIRPVIAIGLDEYYKYLAPTVTGYYDTTGAFLKLPGFTYAYTCQGDKKLTTELLLQNRLNYLDSQWLGGNYTDKKVLQEIFIRANANQSGTSDTFLDVEQLPEAAERRGFTIKQYEDNNGSFIDNGLDARAGYKIKPYLHQSVTYFVDNQPVAPVRYINQPDGVLTNVSPDVKSAYKKTLDVSQQINYIPAANYISSLGDLSLSYPNSIQIFKGNKLLDLNIGSDHPQYYNSLLNAQSDFSIADLPLLKTANFSKLTNFGRDVQLSGSAKLQEFKALGSTLTRVTFAPGAPLHTVLLPASLTGLQLIEHQELKNILTAPPVLMTLNNETGKYEKTDPETYRGLYIEGVTDAGNAEGIGHTLNNIQIRGGKLEYHSYTILKNLVKLKVGARTNKDLAIEYYNVHWSPYTLVEAGTRYDDDITYYELTDHSTYTEYHHETLEDWDNKLINGVIYTYDENATKETITNLDLLGFFITEYTTAYNTNKLNQFYGQTAAIATMPIISGSIYIDNETPIYEKTNDQEINPLKPYYVFSNNEFVEVDNPVAANLATYYEDKALIDESVISSYWNVYYPNLQISAARVIESNITKYVNVLSSGKEELVDVKRSASEHPVQLTALAPTKTNYDFKGWAFDKEGNQMFVNYDYTTERYENFEDALESYTFDDNNKILTLYAIFRIHSYAVNFYNDDGEFLQTVYNDYSTVPGLKEPSIVPTKKSGVSGLAANETYTWLGWYRKIGGTVSKVLIDLSKFTPTADYEFYAAYDKDPSSVYDEQNILDKKYLTYELDSTGVGYRIALNPNYSLTGKVTLPTQIDGISVTELGTVAGSFSPQNVYNQITHIFWAEEDRALKSIKASCFVASQTLVYYEQPDTCRSIGNSAFKDCVVLGLNDPDLFYDILQPVTTLGSNIFNGIRASEIHIPGHTYTSITSGAFGYMTYQLTAKIGKAGDPCRWQEMFNSGLINSSSALFIEFGRLQDTGNNIHIYIYTDGATISNELKTALGVNSTVSISEYS